MQLKRAVMLFPALLLATAAGQVKTSAGVISGRVLDPSDAVIPGASIVLVSAGRELARTSTDTQGEFRLDPMPPGSYEVRVECPGFSPQRARVNLGSKAAALQIEMSIADLQDTLTIDDSNPHPDTSSAGNLDVVHLTPAQLGDLPFMNGDVIGALSQLLGPAALGSGGATVIIDGLQTTETRIPISEIQDIKINNNPYSAEFARPGKARIEIITKSGSKKYHGSLTFTDRDYRLDARNAFATERAPQYRRQLETNLSGPVRGSKQNTFSLTLSRVEQDLQPNVFAQTLMGPVVQNASRTQINTYLSGQLTHRVGETALSFRYTYFDWSDNGEGAGGFVLPEAGYDSTSHYHQLYTSFRKIINPRLMSDLIVRFRWEGSTARSETRAPKIVVLDSFTRGGAQVNTLGSEGRLELSDIISWSNGRHFIRAGFNVPGISRNGSTDQSNVNGTFYFSSLDAFRASRPFLFVQNSGKGHIALWQQQLGGFIQDDIRLRRSLTASLGLRYDWQNYVSNYRPMPRLSVAWAPGKTQKTVFRLGGGIFYDTIPGGAIAETLRFNGSLLRQIQLNDPGYPDPFAFAASGAVIPPNVVRFASGLRLPYNFEYSAAVERVLRKKLTLTTTWHVIRGVDLFRSRDLNAPLPPAYLQPPDPSLGVLRQIESSGSLKSYSLQTMLRGNMTRYFSGMLIHEWGRALSDTNGIDSFPANNWNPRGEWSPASFDTRNFLYAYGTFIPTKFLKLGLIFSANTGRPYTMTTGLDDYHDGLANARPAGVPRNSLRRPGSATLDARWSREFQFHRKEGASLVVALDAFNLFNRVNYSAFSGVLSSPFFGMPVAASPARRLQASLGVRF
jgi:hypothetical protein